MSSVKRYRREEIENLCYGYSIDAIWKYGEEGIDGLIEILDRSYCPDNTSSESENYLNNLCDYLVNHRKTNNPNKWVIHAYYGDGWRAWEVVSRREVLLEKENASLKERLAKAEACIVRLKRK